MKIKPKVKSLDSPLPHGTIVYDNLHGGSYFLFDYKEDIVSGIGYIANYNVYGTIEMSYARLNSLEVDRYINDGRWTIISES